MASNTLYKQNKFVNFCTQAAMVITGILFSLLAFGSFVLTVKQKNDDPGTETLEIVNDNLLVNIGLLLVFTLLVLLCIRKHVKPYKINTTVIIVIMVCVTTLICGLWNITTQFNQLTDSSIVSNAARELANDNYASLLPGNNPYSFDPTYYNGNSYFDFYPFQLGYVFIAEILIRIFGTGTAFFTLKLLNILTLDFTYIALVLIINKLTNNKTITNLTAIALTFCLQSVFFTVFTYGNIPGVCFAMWAVYFIISYIKDNKISKAIIALPFAIFAILAKYNNIIVLIAIAISLILHTINKKRLISLLLAVIVIALPYFSQQLVIKSYEARANTNYETKVKQSHYLAGGLNDGVNPGWYNDISINFLKNTSMNQELADSNAQTEINNRLEYFSQHPDICFDFFYKKILCQYLDSSYQSLWLNHARSHSSEIQVTKFTQDVISGGTRSILLFYFDFYVTLTYIGFALYLLRKFIRNETSPEEIIIPVSILGGLIYHTLFEAKSQYIYTYFLMMIPFAVAGLYYVMKAIYKRTGFLFGDKIQKTKNTTKKKKIYNFKKKSA